MPIKKVKIDSYSFSLTKRVFDVFFSFLCLILLAPLFCFLSVLIVLTSGFPVYFIQKRIGKDGKVFEIVKFRTMQKNASKDQYKYKKFNEADGPVFKIYNDPRFTKFGKVLSRTGLDELPQLVNVLKGDMSIVGPRPLPVKEAKKLTKAQKYRELVKPGITSSWVTEGSHNLRFREWMALDRKYIENASPGEDIRIIVKTLNILLKWIV